eukprot:1794382-Prymnesium_polylepis.1
MWRASYAAHRDLEFVVAVVEDRNLKVVNPLALDLLALRINDDVLARAYVDQVLEGVVHVPRAAT